MCVSVCSLGRVSAYTQAGLAGERLLTQGGGEVRGRRGRVGEDSYDYGPICVFPIPCIRSKHSLTCCYGRIGERGLFAAGRAAGGAW